MRSQSIIAKSLSSFVLADFSLTSYSWSILLSSSLYAVSKSFIFCIFFAISLFALSLIFISSDFSNISESSFIFFAYVLNEVKLSFIFSMAVSVNLAISVTFVGSTFTVSKNSPDTKPPIASCNFAGSNFILLFLA